MTKLTIKSPGTTSPGQPAEPGDSFPLSTAQERLWFIHQLAPKNSAYNLAEAWRLHGELTVEALSQALEAMVRRHEPLRTCFYASEGRPVQRVLKPMPVPLPIFDLRTDGTRERTLAQSMEQQVRQPFELSQAPLLRASLFRIEHECWVLLVVFHHIIVDEISLGVFWQELSAFYEAYSLGREPSLAELSIQFADFAAWERSGNVADRFSSGIAYWQRQLAGKLPKTALPPDGRPPANATFSGATMFRSVPRWLASDLRAVSRQHGATLYSTLLSAFQILMSRYCASEDVLVGSIFSGRERPETEGLIGFFATAHALRARIAKDATVAEVIATLRETALGAFAHQCVPMEMVLRELRPDRDGGKHPLFQVVFGLQPGATEGLHMCGLKAARIEIDNGGAKFDLGLFVTETDEGLRLRCEYSTDLYQSATVERFLRQFQCLLEQIAKDPCQPVSKLSLLDEHERATLLHTWNQTALPVPEDKCIHDLVLEQAGRTPDATALVDASGRMSYRQLAQLSARISRALLALGAKPETPIALCLRRSNRLIAGMLGILQSGAAYVPIDPAYPRDRVELIIEDCHAPLILTERAVAALLPPSSRQIVCVEDILATDNLEPELAGSGIAGPQNLAYVIHTSGSTGRPKGVAIEHANTVSFLCWARASYSQEDLAGVLAGTSVCFDLSVFEIFAPLICGGKVVIAENALSLPSLAAANEITLINTVPSALRELLRLKAIPSSVKIINLAGEPLPADLVNRIYSETGVEKVYDLYGPSETTTYSTGILRQPDAPATIGKPLANERVYILDERLEPAPVGMAGELYIGGRGVARGYLNRPDLTGQRFISDPFLQGERLYRTGDMARWRNDGSIEFLGRMDQQLKIRGFRIEPGEIESLLHSLPGVKDALVMAREVRPEDQRLIAYLVKGEPEVNSSSVHALLSARLPQFMVPNEIVVLPEFPMTPNGKVDRNALPLPSELAASHEHAPPKTETEAKLVQIWQELLGRNSFGVRDNFFQLGGHSLLATQIVSRISTSINVTIPLRAIFECATVEQLASVVDTAATQGIVPPAGIPKRIAPSEAEGLLARLDTMSEEELDELLRNPEFSSLLK